VTFAAGDLDRIITLQQRTVTRDSLLGEVVTWPDLATVRAQVIESSAPVAVNNAASDAVQLYARPHKIRIRFRVLDKASVRISYGGRLLRITGTAELGRRERIELACEEWAHE